MQSNDLDNLVKNYIEAQNLTHNPIGIGCSAGLDSMALLKSLLNNHPNDLIYCLHLDHGLREDSFIAHDFLVDFCKTHRIQFLSKTLKSGELDGDENSAREARYIFFEEACKSKQIQNLFLAHTANDNAETILFRVFRGTNSKGLCGIPAQRSINGVQIHRPLLESSRRDIENFFAKQKFIEDSSNTNLNYARNRIRNQIMPEALLINPQAISNISKLSSIIKEEQEFLLKTSSSIAKELGDPPWSLIEFQKIPRIIQRKILEDFFTTNIDFVNQFLDAISKGGFHRINFSKNKFFTIRSKKILLEQST